MENINLPNSLKGIGYMAFQNCSKLSSIEIPNSVITIDRDAFKYCTNLISVIIPNSVTTIGYAAFQGCTSLISVELPDSITSIERITFENCTSLKSIYIPKSVITINTSNNSYMQRPFYRCSDDLKIYCGSSEKLSGWDTYWNYCDETTALDVTYDVTREEYKVLISQ